MNLIRKILFPLVPIYYIITWLRNKLYDWNIKSSKSYTFPVMCVGNLSVGGTGKSPMIEYLISLLKDKYKVATLSRGYKRKTKGFVLANSTVKVEEIGDEPFQFYNKFSEKVLVAVDENRQSGINKLLQIENSPEVILLDDAFQHRKVSAGFNILLTQYNNLYINDFVLPTGNLREPRHGAKRADVIVVTKCPKDLSSTSKSEIIKRLNPKSYQKVFFSSIEYSDSVIGYNESIVLNSVDNFTLVTGIANPKPLIEYLKLNDKKFEHLDYKDHHDFSESEVKTLSKRSLIITTEKDYMRLKQYEELKEKLYYLPIKIVIDQSSEFDELVNTFISNYN